jgi:AcrR family transcriptional regulator
MSSEKRKYELKERAQRQEETRRRIAAATAELHAEVGPARTTIAEIARRAGVQRLTVYNNFPDESQLFAACQRHFMAENPLPELASALAAEDPGERLETVLRDLYGWFRQTERMSTNVRRDRQLMPALDAVMAEGDSRVAALADTLAAGFADGQKPSRAVRAAVALALDFWAWRRLALEGLDDGSAARLMADAVRGAAAGQATPGPSGP